MGSVSETITVGVLALQGGFAEHLSLLRKASQHIQAVDGVQRRSFVFTEVRSETQLALCDALIIPGGESTTMSIVAARLGLLEPLRTFVKVDRKPVWGTCAGLVMLAEHASATKQGGQELIGGLDVRVLRNRYGRQTDSFVADLSLSFLSAAKGDPDSDGLFPGVFIRAPVVEEILPVSDGKPVEILATVNRPAPTSGANQVDALPDSNDIVAVKQGNVFGTSFHPELTDDVRIHVWWLQQILELKTALAR